VIRWAIPSAVTGLGLVFGLAGVVLYPDPLAIVLLALGIVADEVDGRLARYLGTCTTFGARFDWSVDCVLAVLLAWRVLPAPLAAVACGALAVWWAYARNGERLRVSGRAAMTALAVWMFFAGRGWR
jgi:phosphatidylglycerophosphate synthase